MMVLVLLLAAGVDGWKVSVPDPTVRAYFANWSQTVGELNHVTLGGLLKWSGWLLLPAPLILLWLGWKKQDRAAWFWWVMLTLVSALTCWQARWGYFFGLVFVMSLPTLLGIFSRRWIAWVVFVLSLWPIVAGCTRTVDRLNQAILRAEQRADNLALYDVAMQLRGQRRLPVLAPWWQCPALAYWSGQPCVAGSSHESLPGTVDTSRFYLSIDPEEAVAILERRRVACVVAYDFDRVNLVSRTILGEPDKKGTMAQYLYERPHSPPPFLQVVYTNSAFRVFLRPDGLEP